MSYNSYGNRRQPYRRDRSRSKSSEQSRRIDRFRPGWRGRSKSPESRRGRKARSRSKSVDVKKSKASRSQSRSSGVKKSDELEKENTTTVAGDSSSKVSKPSELELKKDVGDKSKTDVSKLAVSGKATETSKNLDQQTGSIQGPSSMEKIMDEKKKWALDMAVNMYIRAEDYYDGGNLWCRKCNLMFTDILALCQHLHSDQHQTVSPLEKRFRCSS